MSRWLLVSEGGTELGVSGLLEELLCQLARDDDPRLVHCLRCGPWEPVRLPEVLNRTVQQLAREETRANRPGRRTPVSSGLSGKAKDVARALHAARALGCEAVIFLVDADGKDKRLGEVKSGFAACDLPHAWGVAKEMVEAWLIADADLLSPVGFDTGGRKPEDLWGDPHSPESGHPKRVFMRACGEARLSRPEARERWCLSRAAPNSPSLREFCVRVVDLLRDRSLCTPIARA